jgi:PleD family two-component response regulator
VQPSRGEDRQPPFAARLDLPAVDEAAILIVDDNADALQLFERYLAGTGYTFAGTTDPRQTLALAQELRPRIVVLDVMLPIVDGFHLSAK